MINYIIYTSYTRYPWDDESLLELLKKSNSYNRSHGITGMLIFLRNKFLQILEGKKEEIDNLYGIIEKDERHERVNIIIEGQYRDRIFKDWSMGFKVLTERDFEKISGYKDLNTFFSESDISDESHPAQIFLKYFYDQNLRDFSTEFNPYL